MSLQRKLSGATTVGVIGSAGRRGDAEKMTRELFYQMLTKLETVITKQFKLNLGKTQLISGGAAWADHLAVVMFIKERVPALTLHLPAPFKDGPNPHFYETDEDSDGHGKGETSIEQGRGKGAQRRGKTKSSGGLSKERDNARFANESAMTGREVNSAGLMANRYHREFTKKMCENTLEQLLVAKFMGAELKVHKGFKVRNTAVAESSEYLIAFTWNDGDSPKHKGGTADTWEKYKKFHKNRLRCVHVPLSSLEGTASKLNADCDSESAISEDLDSDTSQKQLTSSNTSESLQPDPQSRHTDSSTSQSLRNVSGTSKSQQTDLGQNISSNNRKRTGFESSEIPDAKRQYTSS